MDRRYEKPVNRPLRRTAPPRPNGAVAILAFVAVFLAGLGVGGTLLAPKTKPPALTAHDAASTLSFFLKGAPPGGR